MQSFCLPRAFSALVVTSFTVLVPLFPAHHSQAHHLASPIFVEQHDAKLMASPQNPSRLQQDLVPLFSVLASPLEVPDKKSLLAKLDNEGFNPLQKAAKEGNVLTVHSLIEEYKKADLLNSQNLHGCTALMLAAWYGHEPCVKSLVDAGAEVILADKDGFNAFHYASQEGNTSIVQLFIPIVRKAGQLDAQTKEGFTALILASLNGHEACVKALIEGGVDILAIQHGTYFNALHCAAQEGKTNIVGTLIPLFLKAGFLNAYTKEGNTALILAAFYGHSDCVKMLIEAGAHLNYSNYDGFNALHCAAANGKIAVIKVFMPLFNKINFLNIQDKEGCTPLILAAFNGHDSCVNVLLEGGADIVKADKNGATALHSAAANGKEGVVRMLIPRFLKVNLLNVGDVYGNSALMLAAGRGHDGTIKMLIEAGADSMHTNKKGFNALHCAANEGRSSVIQFLLPFFRNAQLVDALTQEGHTAYRLALSKRHEACAKLLTQNSAQ